MVFLLNIFLLYQICFVLISIIQADLNEVGLAALATVPAKSFQKEREKERARAIRFRSQRCFSDAWRTEDRRKQFVRFHSMHSSPGVRRCDIYLAHFLSPANPLIDRKMCYCFFAANYYLPLRKKRVFVLLFHLIISSEPC